MNIRHACIISILIIATISIGCIEKSGDGITKDVSPGITTGKTEDAKIVKNTTLVDNNIKNDAIKDGSQSDVSNASEEDALVEDTESDNSSIDNETDDTMIPADTSTPDLSEDTSVSEIFKIGEEKKILGKNIKLVNITNYDDNSITVLIDGVEYKYSSDSVTNVNGIEISDVITSEDDKTAEIIVDRAAK